MIILKSEGSYTESFGSIRTIFSALCEKDIHLAPVNLQVVRFCAVLEREKLI